MVLSFDYSVFIHGVCVCVIGCVCVCSLGLLQSDTAMTTKFPGAALGVSSFMQCK